MIKRKVVLFFVLLIIMHILHILEEILGKAHFIEEIFNGTINFLMINILLISIPIFLLYTVIIKKKLAYYLTFVYAFLMIIDGMDHIIRNYTGFYTSILFIILAPILLFYLLKESKNERR